MRHRKLAKDQSAAEENVPLQETPGIKIVCKELSNQQQQSYINK